MTTFFSKKNNAESKIATVGGIDNSTDPVTFAVTTGEGSKFPASNFVITIDNEILICTSRTGDNLTCSRAAEGTTIAAHTQNTDVELRITAAQLVEHETAINALPVSILTSSLYAPQGFLINGLIAVSVASNDLVVAIKGMNGNDPSATNPVYCRIGNVVRTITAPLSKTLADGTNWFNSGGAQLATKEVDYFVYLGYNSTDGVVLGFASFPYATKYDDFSVTTTNDKYCAISTITNAAAADNYEVIGRFSATLSAGAGYTWTVPSFTNLNLIQRPIFRTRKLTYNPVHGAQGGYTNAPTTNVAEYYIEGRLMYLFIDMTYNATSGGSSYSTVTLPRVIDGGDNRHLSGTNMASGATLGCITTALNFYIYKHDGSSPIVNSNRQAISGILLLP